MIFKDRNPLYPPSPGKAIKLSFFASPKTLVSDLIQHWCAEKLSSRHQYPDQLPIVLRTSPSALIQNLHILCLDSSRSFSTPAYFSFLTFTTWSSLRDISLFPPLCVGTGESYEVGGDLALESDWFVSALPVGQWTLDCCLAKVDNTRGTGLLGGCEDWTFASSLLSLTLLLPFQPLSLSSSSIGAPKAILRTWFLTQNGWKVNQWHKLLLCVFLRKTNQLYPILVFWRFYQLKDSQLESCKLSSPPGKMRTAAWETAPQMTLRDCSKEAVGEGQYIRFLRKRSSKQSSAYFTKGFLLVTRSWCHQEGI